MMVPAIRKSNSKKILSLCREFLRVFLNWCFGGAECLVCGKTSSAGELCIECREKVLYKGILKYSIVKRCSFCGKFLLSEDKICTDCRKERVINSCDLVVPLLPYRLWAKNLMFHWKVLEKRGLSAAFAELVHKAISCYFESEQKILVPVPPRPGKIHKKGWDQIDELCSFLEFRYGYKILHLLKRNGKIQQKKLDRKHRLDSGDERYSLLDSALRKEKIPDCVILIDDVMTTGSTLETCAKLLKSAGITKVNAMTIFIVD